LGGFSMTEVFTCGMGGRGHRRGSMSAQDFINETLLPKLERELADEAKGNKPYLAGFEDALKAMTQFIESQRDEWDVSEEI
jgi:hypothetical protein